MLLKGRSQFGDQRLLCRQLARYQYFRSSSFSDSPLSFKHYSSSCRVHVPTDSPVLKSAFCRVMVAETPPLIIWSKTFFIAAANATSVLTYIMFLQVKTQLISLPGKFPTSIVRCQRGLGGRSSVCLRRPTPSTLCLWIAIVKVMEQASACSTLHLVQLRVLAELMFFHSLCFRTTTCTCSRRLF